jgi:hypothetical protein
MVFDKDKHVWLAIGSFWREIKLCEIDRQTGEPIAGGFRLLDLAERPDANAIEQAGRTE